MHQTPDPNARKRHWWLAVWSVPQAGHFAPMSAYLWTSGRNVTIPQINTAKQQRQLPDASVLTGIHYVGYQSQYELTGTKADPIPSALTPAYNLGLEQALAAADPTVLVNVYTEAAPFERSEWQAGYDRGLELRKKHLSLSASMLEVPQAQVTHDVR